MSLNTKDASSIAAVLIQALPYIRRFAGEIMVLKLGGAAMKEQESIEHFCQDVTLMRLVGIKPIVVHGGGSFVNQFLAKHKINLSTEFVDGIRVTDDDTMEVVEMVLGGRINKDLVNTINHHGGRAIGVTGKDSNLIIVTPLVHANGQDYGRVGQVKTIDKDLLLDLSEQGYIPVIAPVGVGEDGRTYNINADTVAAAVAVAIKAKRLILLSDVAGILDADGKVISHLTTQSSEALLRDNSVVGGMLPKLRGLVEAINKGVASGVITDGRLPHATLVELFTDEGVGTLIEGEQS